jgi:phage gpG-like protein
MRLAIGVNTSFADVLESVAADGRAAVTAGIRGGTTALKDTMRAQVRANFASRSLPTTWQQLDFPKRGQSLRAAGRVFSQVPEIIDAYTQARSIRGKRGQRLAIPTGWNAARGRRGRGEKGLRITTAQMAANPSAFVIRAKARPDLLLWCLPVGQGEARLSARGRRSRALVAGGGIAIASGRGRGLRRKEVLKQGFVPMFLLLREVRLAKRIDLDGPIRATSAAIPRRIVAAWRDGAGRPRPVRTIR